MPVGGIGNIINAKFVQDLGKARANGNAGKQIADIVSGKNSDNLQVRLTAGARTTLVAIQNLSNIAKTINIAKNSLGKLNDVVDDLVKIATTASEAGTSSIKRDQLDLEFRKLVKEFRKEIKESDVGGQDVLSKEGLTNLLKIVGINIEESETLKKAFEDLTLSDDDTSLISERTKGERAVLPAVEFTPENTPTTTTTVTIQNPGSAPGSGEPLDEFGTGTNNIVTTVTTSGISGPGTPTSILPKAAEVKNSLDGKLNKRIDAVQTLNNLKALQKQIKNNSESLNKIAEGVGANIDVIRSAGITLGELSASIVGNESAQVLADEVRKNIQKNVSKKDHLKEIHNLDNVIAAALLSESNDQLKALKSSLG